MKAKYGLLLILMLAAVITVSAMPCWAQGTSEEKEKKEDIWTEGDTRGPGRRGPRRGPRFDLTEEEIDRIIKSIKQSNPEKAKDLENMRKEDSDRFQPELREHGRDEFSKIVLERIDKWRKQRREEFLKWLDENFPRQAQELKKLLQDPDLYLKKYEIIRQKYWPIFEAERRNPELGEVLKEKLKLGSWRDRLLREIRGAKDAKKKKELINKLKDAVSRRFDLIVREKKITYKRLRDRLKELQERMEKSQAEIDELKDPKTKKQNIDKRVDDLLKQKGKR
ncbi:MAG: S46 family peptidase [Planctomycetes bacterium]|nr:S46 family peptidase [Planctomycetota bacterium]